MQILYYTCLVISFTLFMYVIFRKRKKKHVQEYQTPYNKAREKAREDLKRRRK